ncbi:hypothetical protein JOD03_002520 [Chryseomicrobium aureum]|nr:hypothetical protein [Chryseomicrobium aureum]
METIQEEGGVVFLFLSPENKGLSDVFILVKLKGN